MILDNASNIVHEASVHFDRDLPHHGTMNGAIRGPDAGEVTSPVRMWLEAIDLICERLYDDCIDFGAIVAISGAGQVSFPCKWLERHPITNRNSNMVLYTGRIMQTNFLLV